MTLILITLVLILLVLIIMLAVKNAEQRTEMRYLEAEALAHDTQAVSEKRPLVRTAAR